MPRPEPRRIALLSAAAYSGMFVFGIVMALLGAILPAMAGRLEFQVADIGTLFLVMNGAMLAASLVLGLAMDRFGIKPPLAIGAFLVAAALVIVARATALSDLLAAVVLLGIGGGALNGGTNTLVADLHEDPQQKMRPSTCSESSLASGRCCCPLRSARCWRGSRWRRCCWPQRYPVAWLACSRRRFAFPRPNRVTASPWPTCHASCGIRWWSSLRVYSSSIRGGVHARRIHRYLLDTRNGRVGFASLMGAHRLLGSDHGHPNRISRVASRTSPHRVLLSCASGALVGALVAAAATGPALAFVGIVMMGMSLAGVFPAALGIAGARFETHSGTVFGILFTVALAGGMTLPWTAGQIGGIAGLRSVFLLVAFWYAAILALSRAAARFDRRRGEPAMAPAG